MKISTCLLLLGLVVIITASNVKNLTDQNFNETISSNKYVMVKFFAPWCGHCKTMAPDYEKLAEMVKENGVIIGQVDATIQKQTAQAHKVEGYPTIKFFIDGVSIDYRGQRTTDEMFAWIKKVSQTTLQQITQEKLQQLKGKQPIAVYFGSDAERRKTIELLNIVDNTIHYYVIASTENKLVLYSTSGESFDYPSAETFSYDAIKQWAMMKSLPTVVPLSSKEYLDWVFYDAATLKDVIMLLKETDVTDQGFENFKQFCETNKATYKCCVVDSSMEVYGGVKNYLKSKGKSVLGLTRDALKEAYAYPNAINELNEQSWKQFVAEVDAGKLRNLASPDAGQIKYEHVKVLTDENYTSFIKENGLVFMEFYTTSCGHCVEFAPTFDTIAKKFYDDNTLGVQIAALDIKKNKEVASDLRITSFPTFMVFVSGFPITFDAPRTYESIFEFVKNAKESKPIPAVALAEVPTPSVVIYDPAEASELRLLPALFSRYPIYHIREGKEVSVVLKQQTDKKYSGDVTLELVSKWLYKQTDPILVNLLNPNIDNKLKDALESKVHILGLIDIDSSLSTSLRTTLEEYCKESSLVCGVAKKGESNFNDFVTWLGVDTDSASSFVYINTETFDRYLFNKKIEELSLDNISQFITEVKEGKIKSLADQKKTEEAKPQEPKKAQAETGKAEEESKQSDQSEQTSENEL